ncbi:DUF6801 domain-containing protein [Streptomyces sp. NPDC048669]|uniref:DUF6801 domain-containing protein n=1 Tax=Streptomyces sp. NPDC048669 TaxID=3155267 RepID=UPI0034441F7C
MRFRTSDPRRAARVATVGALALMTGLMTGTGEAADTRVAEADFDYTCESPSGPVPVEVTVKAELPLTANIGSPIQVHDVGLSFALPRSAVSGLPGIDSALVSGAVSVVADVSQRGETTSVPWQGLEIPEGPVPAEGDLEFTAAGDVPTITPRSSGTIGFALGHLDVGLAFRAAEGEPAAPPPVALSCTIDPDQSAELADVDVPPLAGTSSPGPGAPPDTPGTSRNSVGSSGEPKAQDDPKTVLGKVNIPPDCTVASGPMVQPPKDALGYMAGYSNVNKLDGAAKFSDPGRLRLNLNTSVSFLQCPTGVKSWLTTDGTLDYNGKPQMPPATATFLTFGFMPTTAKLELSLEGRIDIGTLGDSAPDPDTKQYKETTTAVAMLRIRLYDVEVNGEPLDVGANCRTVRPMELTLVGKGSTGTNGPVGYTVKTGGPLTGTSDVPPFAGCGVTEDLDSLFTASVSGKDNFTKMMQSPLCVEGVPANCPEPEKPTPER